MIKLCRTVLNPIRSQSNPLRTLQHATRSMASVNIEEQLEPEQEQRPKKVLLPFSGERSINNVTLLGRVGNTAETRGSKERPVVTFSLATNEKYLSSTGEITTSTEWHRIAVFRPKLRDIAMKAVKKGTRVQVTGPLKYSLYENAGSGKTSRGCNIIAADIIVFGQAEQDNIDTTTSTDPEDNLN